MSNTTNKKTKNKGLLKYWYLLVVLIVLAVLVVFPKNSEASEFSLGVYPPLLKIQADPPASISAPLTIQNLSENSVNLDIIIKPFEAKSETEDETFFRKIQITDENEAIQALSLAPKQKKDLFVKIYVDKDDPQKDYYFYIQFISKDDKMDKDTSYSQILGGVSLTVMLSLGEEDPKATLEEFSSPVFVNKASAPFTIKIRNAGKHFIEPYGIITIQNLLGQTVFQIEIPTSNILKDSTKSIEISWDKFFMLGLYKATLDISMSENGPVFSRSLSFFALPAKEAFIATISILVVIFIFTRIKKVKPK